MPVKTVFGYHTECLSKTGIALKIEKSMPVLFREFFR